jgi:hypothetical protein
VNKRVFVSCALALGLAVWALGQAGAAQRCYPQARFVAASDKLVTDTLTKLIWQKQTSATYITWAAAQTDCPTGFRLPTVKELASIVDLKVASPGPTIDQTAFPGTSTLGVGGFWTSSPCAGLSGQVWVVFFDTGMVACQDVSSYAWVRCVR